MVAVTLPRKKVLRLHHDKIPSESHAPWTLMWEERHFRLFCISTAALALAMMIPARIGRAQTLTTSQQKADRAYQQGMKLLRARQYVGALQEFKRVEQFTPHLPQGYTGEGIALALMGKPEESLAPLGKALQLDPSYWVARRERGIIEWNLNRKEDAAKDLGAVAKLFRDDPSVNAILAQYEFEEKHYSQAASFFAKAPAEVTASPRLSLMAAQALVKTGELKAAASLLESLGHAPDRTPEQQFRIAWLLGEAKDYPGAIRLFNSLPQDFSDPFGRGYGIALAYFEEGDYARCVKTLTGLQSQGILRPALFSLLGTAEEKRGHTLQAYDAFRQGIYKFPHDDENYLNIATLSVEHFNYEVAAQVLSSGIQENPGDNKLYLSRGVVYTLRMELRKAQGDYGKALALDPQESSAYVALGICLMDQDYYAQATTVLREGLHRQLKDVLLYYFLVDALFRQGITASSPLYQEAFAAVQSSLRLDPGFAYGYLQRGRLELMSNQLDAAISDLEHARALAPDSRAVLYQLGVADRRAGRKAEAGKLFDEMAEASKEEAAKFRKGKLMEIMMTISNSELSAR